MATSVNNLLYNKEFITSAFTGNQHTILLSNLGRIFVCGENFYGQLGIGEDTSCLTLSEVKLNEIIVSIASSETHTLLTVFSMG
ncbi:MAG: hypothetical protein H0T84_03175 [Tatlockia sp.]|nr:hypothetical protein [Tatlockia sp.]